jgi:hypothetical protein
MRAFFGRHGLYLWGTTVKTLRFCQFERRLQSIRNMKVCELFARILSESAHNPLIVEKYLIVDSCVWENGRPQPSFSLISRVTGFDRSLNVIYESPGTLGNAQLIKIGP